MQTAACSSEIPSRKIKAHFYDMGIFHLDIYKYRHMQINYVTTTVSYILAYLQCHTKNKMQLKLTTRL